MRLATEHVDETYGPRRPVDGTGGEAGAGEATRGEEKGGGTGGKCGDGGTRRRMGREERAGLIDETARVLSDTYLRAVLTGQVTRMVLVRLTRIRVMQDPSRSESSHACVMQNSTRIRVMRHACRDA